MKKRTSGRLSPKAKRIVIWSVAILAAVLLVYAEVIRPNQDAKSYTERLSSSSQPLEKCFEELTKTTELKSFYAPDIALDIKQQDMTTILQKITACREELKRFDTSAQQLLSLRLAGYTPTYREARINQRQAFDVIGQSNDVLDQYRDLASFLQQYYDHINNFKNYTAAVAVDTTYYGNSRLQEMQSQAADLRKRADQINQLKAPAEFNETKKATGEMFRLAADGLENLVAGYTTSGDYYITTGYKQIDDAVGQYDGMVINMPFEHLTMSYIPKQVMQLPAKVENLLSTSSE